MAAAEATRAVKCPICGANAVEAYKPFCSRRCADVDLAKWFTGGYVVAGREDDDDRDDPARPDGLPTDVERDER